MAARSGRLQDLLFGSGLRVSLHASMYTIPALSIVFGTSGLLARCCCMSLTLQCLFGPSRVLQSCDNISKSMNCFMRFTARYAAANTQHMSASQSPGEHFQCTLYKRQFVQETAVRTRIRILPGIGLAQHYLGMLAAEPIPSAFIRMKVPVQRSRSG